jgi:uncharacterized protein (TIGR00156 family)
VLLAIAFAMACSLILLPQPSPLHAQGGAAGTRAPGPAPDPALSPGGFKGPQLQTTTVAQALKAGDDTDVILKGRIVRPIGREKFIFKDDTGEAAIDVAVIWMGNPDRFRVGAEIMVFGDVDKDPNGDVEINVTKIAPAE